MPEMRDLAVGNLGPAQAAELTLLVDLEARWENLRHGPLPSAPVMPTLRELQAKQAAYESFRTKLALYTKRYGAVQVSEVLLNTPARLEKWCRVMHDLLRRVESDPHTRCPQHLLEKAYRWADRVASRVNTDVAVRTTPAPTTVSAAIEELERLGEWCRHLAGATPFLAVPA